MRHTLHDTADVSSTPWHRSSLGLATVLFSASLAAWLEAADPPATSPTADGVTAENFDRGLLPKVETGATRFLESHGDSDGRGVVVAIFDTGVDPGAKGLKTTTDGKLKVIDIIDGTGSGDVDTSTVRQANSGKLEGLTGRTLKIPASWKNPSGKFHVGWKRAYDLYPGDLVSRIRNERKKRFDRQQRVLLNRLAAQLVAFDQAHPKPEAKERLAREELVERSAQLKATSSSLEDPGPVFDCVVWHDGTRWRAVVDTDEDGDLDEESILTTYRDEPGFGTFSDQTLLNFSVNIFENGNLLSVVTTCGAHGTHVAGIVAAHYPDTPQRNGLAPGAQIVSVKIGDTRLGSMETGAGLVRGLGAVLRNRCDLVNMSYGEPSHIPNRGRLVSLFSELVDEHGVVFVASAGNSGPALSTVGSPGGTTRALLGVGAYVSPAMMKAEYSLRKLLPGMPYTWSSRGPTADGDAGVDIFAPGGAVAPVPEWTLQGSMQMNGTSMSSPNACGNLALLISGLKQKGIPYTPTSIRRAIRNTATPIPGLAADGFGQGPGLLQVDKAWEHLETHAKAVGESLPIDVSVVGGRGRRGIYLRDRHETAGPASRLVRLTPRFPEGTDNAKKVAFGLSLALTPTVDWIDCGDQLLLTHGGGSFRLVVDPTDLPPGGHLGEILITDTRSPARGPLARVPVTVIKAESLKSESTWQQQITFEPGHLARRFLDVPQGATWADISLVLQRTPSPSSSAPAPDTPKRPGVSPTPDSPTRDVAGPNRRVVLHTVQLRPGRSFRDDQSRSYLTLRPGAEVVHSIPVVAGRTLEVCLAQYWSSLGNSAINCTIQFRGLVPDTSSVALVAGQGGARIRLHNQLAAEDLGPQASLNTHRTLVRPKSSTVAALSTTRDFLPRDRVIHRLVLEYEIKQPRTGSVSPRFPDLDNQLYDSRLGTQLWMLFDENKRRIATDDTFPGTLRLPRGTYRLRLQLRHSDESVLNRHKSLVLAVDRPLSRPITLALASSHAAGRLGLRSRISGSMAPGTTRSLQVLAPRLSQVPPSAEPGDLLLGTVHYGRPQASHRGAGRRPGGFPITVSIPTGPPATKSNTARPAGSLKQDQRAFLLDRLSRIPFEKQRKDFDDLANQLLAESPANRKVLTLRLERLDHPVQRKQRLAEVVAAADTLIATFDTDKLAQSLGRRGAGSSRGKADRDALADALYRKGRALGYMELPDVLAKHPIADKAAHDRAFEANFKALSAWVDTTDAKYVLLHVRRERRRGRDAVALKWLQKYYPGTPANYWYVKKRRDLYEKLGWSHCHEYERRWLLIRFPTRYESF